MKKRRRPAPKPSHRNRWLATVTCAVATLLALCGWFYLYQEDRELAAVRSLQAEAFSEGTRALPEAERRAKFQQYRDQYEHLSKSQQQTLRRERGEAMHERRMVEIREYFQLNEKQKRAFLDNQINEMEKRKRSFQNRGGQRPGPPRNANGRGGGGADRQERRDRFRRGFLDGTSPQDRAQMAEYMKALRERREQRGLPELRRGPRHYTV